MNITNKNIDGGTLFDWGRTSSDYARFRDIYPQLFYDKIIKRNLCIDGRKYFWSRIAPAEQERRRI